MLGLRSPRADGPSPSEDGEAGGWLRGKQARELWRQTLRADQLRGLGQFLPQAQFSQLQSGDEPASLMELMLGVKHQ